MLGMKYYPVVWGFFHKPRRNKDPFFNNQYFIESTVKVFFLLSIKPIINPANNGHVEHIKIYEG